MMDSFTAFLLGTSLRAGLVLVIVAAVFWFLRRRSAELRHFVWLAAILAVLVIPIAGAVFPSWDLPILPGREAASSSSWQVAVTSADEVASAPARRHAPVPWLFLLWAGGFAALAVREIVSRRRLRALVSDSRPSSPRIAQAAAEIDPRIPCRVSATAAIPLATGVFKPLVLLPESAESWSPACLRGVLLHEIAHHARRDPLWISLARVARALYWFHPLVWLAVMRLRDESERACDDAAVRGGEKPSRYAETLLFVAERFAPQRADAALAFVRRSNLESRITGILSAGRDRRALGARRRTLVASLAAALALVLAIARPIAGSASPEAATPAPQAAGVSPREWLASAKAAAPTPALFRNLSPSPVRISEASVRVVPRVDQDDSGVTMPELALENTDPSRAVLAVLLALDTPGNHDRTWCAVAIPPRSAARLRLPAHQWSLVAAPSHARRLVLHISAVRFEGGDSWTSGESEPGPGPTPGIVATPPTAASGPNPEIPVASPTAAPVPTAETPGVQPTPAPRAKPGPDGAVQISSTFPFERSIAARFRNPDDAPVIITEARTPIRPAGADDGQPMTYAPAVRVLNRSSRRVVAIKLRYKAKAESHAVSVFRLSLGPGESAVVSKDKFDMWGRAQDMTVQIVGVLFENSEVWGELDSEIDARDEWVGPLRSEK